MEIIPNLITKIVLAEFDIDKGSCIRTQYPPCEPSPDDGYLAEQLLPDGSEKHSLGRSFVILGHRKPSSSFSIPAKYTKDTERFVAELKNQAAKGNGGGNTHASVAASSTPAGDPASDSQSPTTSLPAVASSSTSALPPPLLEDILTIDAHCIIIRRLGEVLHRVQHSSCVVELELKSVPVVEWEGALSSVVLRLDAGDGKGRKSGGLHTSNTHSPSEEGSEEAWGSPRVSHLNEHGGEGPSPFSSTIEFLVSPNSVEQLRRLVEEYKGKGAAVSIGGAPSDSTSEMIRYPTPLFAVAATMTKKDATVRRGGITKGVAFVGPDLVQLSAMWPAVELLVKRCCEIKGTDDDSIAAQHEIVKELYRDIADEVLGLRGSSDPIASSIASSAVLKYVGTAGAYGSGSAFSSSVNSPWLGLRSSNSGQLRTVRIGPKSSIAGAEAIHLPPPNTPPWFMPLNTFGVAEVVAAFKDKFAAILTALLCGRRVVVKGFGCPSTVVSEAALAIGIVGSCIVPDFITTRLFPYSSITYMDKFMGLGTAYVVGTLNPMFDSRSEWWDLLCDLDTGNVTAGISTRMLIAEAQHVEADRDFCRQLMQYLASQGGYLGYDRNVVEQGVRERIAEYVGTIMAAAAHADHIHKKAPVVRSLLECNHKRLMLAQLGGLFDTFVDKHLGGGDFGRVDLQLAVAALRRNEGSTDEDVIQALQTILRCVESGPHGPHNLLSVLPQVMGGVAPIANQLFSTHLAVRVVALEILSRLEGIALGKKAIGCLNSFILLTYEQMRNDMSSLQYRR